MPILELGRKLPLFAPVKSDLDDLEGLIFRIVTGSYADDLASQVVKHGEDHTLTDFVASLWLIGGSR
jgi:hypothetical protein